ncbi:uncharacterized protein IL334_005653 [Kwoniella shivajii]|uniref:Uncharacterized protein n=1 Tax=Kwoniella shivajii TaxID=564305 RepID=A0ABZ1D5U1_9TREE|nr:hypothetical protein IL334_005653 [Kwoniella shivajii]
MSVPFTRLLSKVRSPRPSLPGVTSTSGALTRIGHDASAGDPTCFASKVRDSRGRQYLLYTQRNKELKFDPVSRTFTNEKRTSSMTRSSYETTIPVFGGGEKSNTFRLNKPISIENGTILPLHPTLIPSSSASSLTPISRDLSVERSSVLDAIKNSHSQICLGVNIFIPKAKGHHQPSVQCESDSAGITIPGAEIRTLYTLPDTIVNANTNANTDTITHSKTAGNGFAKVVDGSDSETQLQWYDPSRLHQDNEIWQGDGVISQLTEKPNADSANDGVDTPSSTATKNDDHPTTESKSFSEDDDETISTNLAKIA